MRFKLRFNKLSYLQNQLKNHHISNFSALKSSSNSSLYINGFIANRNCHFAKCNMGLKL